MHPEIEEQEADNHQDNRDYHSENIRVEGEKKLETTLRKRSAQGQNRHKNTSQYKNERDNQDKDTAAFISHLLNPRLC
jgi:hypothetical protein